MFFLLGSRQSTNPDESIELSMVQDRFGCYFYCILGSLPCRGAEPDKNLAAPTPAPSRFRKDFFSNDKKGQKIICDAIFYQFPDLLKINLKFLNFKEFFDFFKFETENSKKCQNIYTLPGTGRIYVTPHPCYRGDLNHRARQGSEQAQCVTYIAF